MNLHWESQWDGTPGKSTKVHQLIKDGSVVAYISQEPGEDFGSEWAYVNGEFQPVIASTSISISDVKKGLESWAMGRTSLRIRSRG